MGLREHEIEMANEIALIVLERLRDGKTSQGGDVPELPCDHELPCKYGCSVVELDGSGATEFEGSGTVESGPGVGGYTPGCSARQAEAAVPRTIREWSAAHERSRLDNAQLTDELEQAKAREVELTAELDGAKARIAALVALSVELRLAAPRDVPGAERAHEPNPTPDDVDAESPHFCVHPNGVVDEQSWRGEGCTGEMRHEIKLDVPVATTPEIVAAALNAYRPDAESKLGVATVLTEIDRRIGELTGGYGGHELQSLGDWIERQAEEAS